MVIDVDLIDQHLKPSAQCCTLPVLAAVGDDVHVFLIMQEQAAPSTSSHVSLILYMRWRNLANSLLEEQWQKTETARVTTGEITSEMEELHVHWVCVSKVDLILRFHRSASSRLTAEIQEKSLWGVRCKNQVINAVLWKWWTREKCDLLFHVYLWLV